MAEQWRNRITGYGEEDPEQLLANPKNWRVHPKHQQDTLAGALDEVGWIDEVTVNKRTGYVVDGHLRVAMAISKGEKTVPVKYVDLSEEEEAYVIATKDPIAAMAAADAEALTALLEQVSTEDEAIQELLDDIGAEAELDLWLSEQLAEGPGGDGAGRQLGDRKASIKPVIYAEDLNTFEQAILLTGNPNRGEALIQICNHYLEAHEAR